MNVMGVSSGGLESALVGVAMASVAVTVGGDFDFVGGVKVAASIDEDLFIGTGE